LLYIAARVELHNMAVSQVRQSANIRDADRLAVLPNVNPRQWDVIAESKSQIVRFDWDAWSQVRVESSVTTLDSASQSGIIEHARTTPDARAMFRFARFPVTRLHKLPSGYRVTFMDFRFYREPAKTALATEVTLDESMKVLNEQTSFVQKIN
jgi:hypothetical protein